MKSSPAVSSSTAPLENYQRPCVLYVHIPYCLHKCPYCDFNTYAVTNIPEKEYTQALLAELDYYAALPAWSGATGQGRELYSIYFGGGTPSLFSPVSIGRIISAASQHFRLNSTAEITLEANPGAVTFELLSAYRAAGVNRLSFGSQSLSAKALSTLERIHTPQDVYNAVELARAAGFDNINLDLLYGLPDQSLLELHADLQAFKQLNPEHISAYGLTIEKGTPFYQRQKRGFLSLPPEAILEEMFNMVQTALNAAGFEHYEISNFGKPDLWARHNMAYWKGEDYLGLGAGAHSFTRFNDKPATCSGVRWANLALPKKYIEKALNSGAASAWQESLNPAGAIFESLFLGLRLAEGINLSAFEQQFNCRLPELYPKTLEKLSASGHLKLSNNQLSLTSAGLLLADSVIENFVELEYPCPEQSPAGYYSFSTLTTPTQEDGKNLNTPFLKAVNV